MLCGLSCATSRAHRLSSVPSHKSCQGQSHLPGGSMPATAPVLTNPGSPGFVLSPYLSVPTASGQAKPASLFSTHNLPNQLKSMLRRAISAVCLQQNSVMLLPSDTSTYPKQTKTSWGIFWAGKPESSQPGCLIKQLYSGCPSSGHHRASALFIRKLTDFKKIKYKEFSSSRQKTSVSNTIIIHGTRAPTWDALNAK